MDAFVYYTQVVQMRAQQHIPIIVPPLDRRMLLLMAQLLKSTWYFAGVNAKLNAIAGTHRTRFEVYMSTKLSFTEENA